MTRIKREDKFPTLYDFYSSVISKSKQMGRENRYFDEKIRSFYASPGTQSKRFALAGWRDGLEYIDDELNLLISSTGVGKVDYQRGYHGAFIDVGTFVSGRPDCWIQETESQDVHANGRIKRIAVGSSFMGGVSASQYRRRGASIMAIVDILESAGFRVEIDLIATSRARASRTHATTVRAKEASDSLNREKLAYALMNADFFRRFVFGHRGMNQSGWFGADGAGGTINITNAANPDGKPYKDDYDLVFPNADDMYWNGFRTPAQARKQIISELKDLGVTVEE